MSRILSSIANVSLENLLETTSALTSVLLSNSSFEALMNTSPGLEEDEDQQASVRGGSVFYGTEGNDVINGTHGDDEIFAGGGDDLVNGDFGNDTIYGGDGDDRLNGGVDEDHLLGEAGNDVLNGGFDNDLLEGGLGDDVLNGDNGDDVLHGDEGNDTLDGGLGNDILHGGDGDDYLYGGDGHDVIHLGDGGGVLGDQRAFGGAGDDMIFGGDSADIVQGDAGDDEIHGGGGDDWLHGGNGEDFIHGDDGDDTIHGRAHDDELHGGAGDDVIYGGTGNDVIHGGAGNDTIDGGHAHDSDVYVDTVVYELTPQSYSAEVIDGVVYITIGDETDTIINVEQFVFADGEGGVIVVDVEDIEDAVNNTPVDAMDDVASVAEDGSVVISPLANDVDPDVNQTLMITNVTGAEHGTVTINVDGTVTYVPDADFHGTDILTYTVSDGAGGEDTATITIEVTPVNDAPVAADNGAVVNEDGALLFQPNHLLHNDSDIDGDTLSIVSVGEAAHGTVVVNADGSISYVPDADYNGGDSFTYTVSDGNGGTSTATVNILVRAENDGPVAGNDVLNGVEDQNIMFTVDQLLANDLDIEGDNLTITGFGDPEHGSLVIIQDPSNLDPSVMAIEVAGIGVVYYDPPADFNGVDSFTYTVSDGNGGTATGTVTINVAAVNDAPVARDDSGETMEDQSVTFGAGELLANDSDVEGDDLMIIEVGVAMNGTVVLNPDGSITYIPDDNFNGQDSFTYTVSDGNGGISTATVTVDVSAVNDDPVAINDVVVASEDQAVVFDADMLLANDIDIDGDDLMIVAVGEAAHGTVVLGPDGNVVYIPDENFNGVDSFTYTVSDGNGGTAMATVSINVAPVNDDPVAMDDVVVADEDQPLVISAAELLANDSDIDGDDLTIIAVGDAVNGSVVLNPDGSITFTPDVDYNGPASFTYTVSDGNGGVSTATVNVDVMPETMEKPDPLYDLEDYIGSQSGNMIVGTEGDDFQIRGTSSGDILLGLGGNDNITAMSGDDFADGGAGNDVINGANGNDVLFGGEGDDRLIGGFGNDMLQGGDGNDRIDGNGGFDIAFFAGDLADYSFDFDVANYDFSMSAFEEMDLVAGIEVLQFADGLYSVSDIQAWLSGGDAPDALDLSDILDMSGDNDLVEALAEIYQQAEEVSMPAPLPEAPDTGKGVDLVAGEISGHMQGSEVVLVDDVASDDAMNMMVDHTVLI